MSQFWSLPFQVLIPHYLKVYSQNLVERSLRKAVSEQALAADKLDDAKSMSTFEKVSKEVEHIADSVTRFFYCSSITL